MVLDLSGRRCLVTGGTVPSSVGYACATACLDAGAARVVVVGRNVAKLGNSPLPGLSCLEGNLKNPETMGALLIDAIKLLDGRLDVLIISGGNGYSEYLGLDPTDAASYRLMYDVAVLSPLLLTTAAAPYLSQSEGGGSVVMVSSLASHVPWPDTAPFNLAKAAQNALIETLAFKHRQDGFRVNGILPACIHTGALDVMAARKNKSVIDYAALRAESHPMGRIGTPQEVAHAVLFLASPASSFTTGALIPVDGGLKLSSWFNRPKLLAEYVGGAKA
ncbi:short chain dehydrogenase [Nannochloropsis gaditana]|uniref:Short chain dehydrogenase n=1 Tax=Nannochloropsis gaditana TaxID=72520 RepID=W7TG61_9STRA|nr:short chain dehydrogenase [Nannochloropsis gaditana]